MSRYQSRLLTVMGHMVGSRDQAEDLVQEVFLRVYRSRQRYQAGAKFATWLFTIANNVANNARRTQTRRKEVHLLTSESSGTDVQSIEQMAIAPSGATPTRQSDQAERALMVRQAVEQLSERQRMALLLSKFEGMSYADISQTMGPHRACHEISAVARSREPANALGTLHGSREAPRMRTPPPQAMIESSPHDHETEELVAYLDQELEASEMARIDGRLATASGVPSQTPKAEAHLGISWTTCRARSLPRTSPTAPSRW